MSEFSLSWQPFRVAGNFNFIHARHLMGETAFQIASTFSSKSLGSPSGVFDYLSKDSHQSKKNPLVEASNHFVSNWVEDSYECHFLELGSSFEGKDGSEKLIQGRSFKVLYLERIKAYCDGLIGFLSRPLGLSCASSHKLYHGSGMFKQTGELIF